MPRKIQIAESHPELPLRGFIFTWSRRKKIYVRKSDSRNYSTLSKELVEKNRSYIKVLVK